ncbi:flagellar hook-basal body complex protein FliE [Xanthomonas oryzae]|uniref:flagellar hook-basal body complex protein FliE n=1 Tax=Xanthomonas oryzae TaxID=347 RepID=UPI00117DCBD1|nr:flagellar hook-basal body complex protein FliE [Xanthomonas oryzae]
MGDAARGNQIQGLAGAQGTPATQAPSFSETLRSAIGGVNEAQQRAGALSKAFEMGDPNADLARVMVASQQSQVAFRATVEVRNRLVQAYQDVMNMPL